MNDSFMAEYFHPSPSAIGTQPQNGFDDTPPVSGHWRIFTAQYFARSEPVIPEHRQPRPSSHFPQLMQMAALHRIPDILTPNPLIGVLLFGDS